MHIGMIGISHKSAELALRERLAQAGERLFGPSSCCCFDFSFVFLSTCNRMEVYFTSDNVAETHGALLQLLREKIEAEFEHKLYSYFNLDCFFHLAKVTAGMDSLVVGETEIQGQVKRAYEEAHQGRPLAYELHFLFQKCLKIGKQVRAHNLSCYQFPTIEEAVGNAAVKILGPLQDRRILFVGLSEINLKIFFKFKTKGCRRLVLCNRSFDKVRSLADKEGAGLLAWEELFRWPTFDLAIFATKCPHFLAVKEDIQETGAIKLVVDLSVPRNVDPKIARFATLLNVDQLNRAIDHKKKLKAAEMARIETAQIASYVERQISIFHLKTQTPCVLQEA